MKTYDVITQIFKELGNGLVEAKCELIGKSVTLLEANRIKTENDGKYESVSILEHPGGVKLIETQQEFMKGNPVPPATFY